MQPQKMVAFAFELYHITWSFSKDTHIELTVRFVWCGFFFVSFTFRFLYKITMSFQYF